MDASITVPLSVPSAERLEEIYREECAKVAAGRVRWLRFKEAARYLGISDRSFDRKKKTWGLPVSQPDGEHGVKLFYVPDLDALLIAGVVRSATPNVIEFPSIAEQQRNSQRSNVA